VAQPRRPDPQESAAAAAAVQRAADAEILRALKEAYKDVNRRLGQLASAGNTSLERSRLLAIKQAILNGQAEVFAKTGKVIERRRVEAAARAIQVAGRYDEVAFAAVGREQEARALAMGLEATEARAIDTLVARVTGDRIPLSQKVYRSQTWAGNRLENRINSGLARGLSAEQMARELREFVNPNTPGGTRYAAMRLARTEINNAYHAMAIRAAQMKPWIKKVEWHTSRSHVRKDICDTLDGRLFTPDEVPPKPHPQCFCYITPVVDDDDEAFLDQLVAGDFDDFLDEFAARQGIPVGDRTALSGPAAPVEVVPATPAKKAAPRKAARKAPAKKAAKAVPAKATPAATEAATAPPATLQVPTPTRGRNMLQEIIDHLSQYDTGGFMLSGAAVDSPYVQATRDTGPTDKLLTLIARNQGYGLPTVTDRDEVSRLVDQGGYTEGFRGTKNHYNLSAERQMDQLRHDPDFELGTGIYGNGMYVSEMGEVADQFAGRTPGVKPIGKGNGRTIRMAISPAARFIDWTTLRREHMLFGEQLQRQGVHRAIIDMFYDPSIYAAALGYDGIYVEDEGDGAFIEGMQRNRKQWVIFNREVLVLERENG
jgi:SPP1 gp7 family putative phage head morphogenesis protein